MTTNRELTRDTSKSSGSTRSGTLSSRKSSGKTNQDEEENNEKQIPFNEQQQQQQPNGNSFYYFHFNSNYQIFFLAQINDEQLDFSSSMNKRALKLCEPQRKAITVLMTTDE
jgi:CRISPR/Cas system CSM-associated protein Csm4 (group 5 of RAMP superfamily)